MRPSEVFYTPDSYITRTKSNLRFVFCGPYQADSGGKKQHPQHTVNNHASNSLICIAVSARKQNSGIEQSANTQQGQYSAKNSFQVHNRSVISYCRLKTEGRTCKASTSICLLCYTIHLKSYRVMGWEC